MAASVYQIVTNRILDELAKGVVPWHRPWVTVSIGAHNRISGRTYSLLNQLILRHSGEYATFRQWSRLGGVVREGEKPEIITFWKWPESDNDLPEDPDVKGTAEDTERTKKYPVFRYYRVYHISQINGVEPKEEKVQYYNNTPIERGELLVQSYVAREGIELQIWKGNYAAYSPTLDRIRVPEFYQFEDPAEFYSTVMHEMVHSTGHRKRLARDGILMEGFGTESYSKEELVAELGSAMLCNELQIASDSSNKNSAAYIAGWMHALQDDPKMLIFAASCAEKAAKYIMRNER